MTSTRRSFIALTTTAAALIPVATATVGIAPRPGSRALALIVPSAGYRIAELIPMDRWDAMTDAERGRHDGYCSLLAGVGYLCFRDVPGDGSTAVTELKADLAR